MRQIFPVQFGEVRDHVSLSARPLGSALWPWGPRAWPHTWLTCLLLHQFREPRAPRSSGFLSDQGKIELGTYFWFLSGDSSQYHLSKSEPLPLHRVLQFLKQGNQATAKGKLGIKTFFLQLSLRQIEMCSKFTYTPPSQDPFPTSNTILFLPPSLCFSQCQNPSPSRWHQQTHAYFKCQTELFSCPSQLKVISPSSEFVWHLLCDPYHLAFSYIPYLFSSFMYLNFVFPIGFLSAVVVSSPGHI